MSDPMWRPTMINHRLEFRFVPGNGLPRVLATCIECHETVEIFNEKGRVPGALNHRGELYKIPREIVNQWKEFRLGGKPTGGRVTFI
jgi:hypothetical protein